MSTETTGVTQKPIRPVPCPTQHSRRQNRPIDAQPRSATGLAPGTVGAQIAGGARRRRRSLGAAVSRLLRRRPVHSNVRQRGRYDTLRSDVATETTDARECICPRSFEVTSLRCIGTGNYTHELRVAGHAHVVWYRQARQWRIVAEAEKIAISAIASFGSITASATLSKRPAGTEEDP